MTASDNNNGIEAVQSTILAQMDMLPVVQRMTEAELLAAIAERVAALIKEGPDAFYRTMYRLDIPERSIRNLAAGEDVAIATAKLIYQRQIEKWKSRMEHRRSMTENPSDDPELRW